MKGTTTKLTKNERDILALTTIHFQHPSNTDIAQSLGISVRRVKTLIHRACVKMKANNRHEATFLAIMKWGEINPSELYSLEELAEILISLGPDMLRRIAHLVRQGLEHEQLPWKGQQIISTNRRQDTILTRRQRDVLILAGRGVTNIEIANRLYITNNAVRNILHQACTKLGARNRADAVVLALKKEEISIGEIYSLDEVIQALAPLGSDTIEKVAQRISQELGQEPIPSSN